MLLAYVRFETTRTLRNPAFLVLVTIVPIALYLLGARGMNEGQQIGGMPASVWYLASSAVVGAIGAAISGSGARLAAERSSGWARQLRVTPLTESGWLAGRIIASLLTVIPVVVVVDILAFVVGGVRLDAASWLVLTVVVVVGSIPIALIGLIVGLVFREESAQAAQAIVFVLLAFLGGVFAQSPAPPGALRTIVQLSPSYHLTELARIAVGGAGDATGPLVGLVISTVIIGAATLVIYRRSAE